MRGNYITPAQHAAMLAANQPKSSVSKDIIKGVGIGVIGTVAFTQLRKNGYFDDIDLGSIL